MVKYKNIEIPNFENFQEPIIVDNKNFRNKDTNLYFELAFKESNNYPKHNGIIISKDYVHFVDCPICESNNYKQLFVKWGFIIVSCNNCKHTFVRNQIIPLILENVYANSQVDEQFQKRKKQEDLNKYWVLLYVKYLQLLNKKSIQNLKLLDVGAGGGDFIELCDKICDYKLHAMEFSKSSADYLISIVGINNYYRNEISKTDFSGEKFGIITMWGVLEHMSNPVKELKKCKEILDDNGKILILVPNLYSRAFKILGLTIPTLNPRRHLQYFSKDSMKFLCDKVGLKIEEYYQELPVIDLMYDYIDYNEDLIQSILDNNESYYSVYLLSHNN